MAFGVSEASIRAEILCGSLKDLCDVLQHISKLSQDVKIYRLELLCKKVGFVASRNYDSIISVNKLPLVIMSLKRS